MRKTLRKAKKYYRPTSTHRRVSLLQRVTGQTQFKLPFVALMVFVTGVVIFLSFATGASPTFEPSRSNIVVVTHDKEEQTIPTDAKTVGELVDRLDLDPSDGDVVEPGRDTQIIGDNFRVNIYRAVPVTIVDGGTKTFTYSAAATPRSIAKYAGVEVYPEDRLELVPTENFLTDNSIGERVIIDRATPVNAIVYGTPAPLRTQAETVGELIKEKGIKLAADDVVQPGSDTKLTPNMQVLLIRKGTQVQTIEEAIAMPVETVEDKNLSFGASAIRQQGAPGKLLVTYEIQLENGVEVSRKRIQEVVAQAPVRQIVARGTHYDVAANKAALMTAVGIAVADYPYVDYVISQESGWCATKWQGEYGYCPVYHGVPASASIGYGLAQATPAWQMATAGADWATNPVTQLRWADTYARSYGGWKPAYDFKRCIGRCYSTRTKSYVTKTTPWW